ncbi:hypothetical protein [Cognatiluteimonas profundi]|uniref:hypothetical protein n=1 Tax=Cognatiluteimonas profundi TaxID=2594501 RepID=UPI00131B8053|nr:hypothetical protein [Lysobacter profundi]
MGSLFWIRRYLTVFVFAFLVIAVAQLLKGHTNRYAVVQGLIWAAVSASIFTGSRIWQSRRGRHCALCRDTPEMLQKSGAKPD